MCLQCCSVITKRWVAEIARHRVPGHRADNRECPTAKLAATMLWNDELVAAGRAKTLTAGDERTERNKKDTERKLTVANWLFSQTTNVVVASYGFDCVQWRSQKFSTGGALIGDFPSYPHNPLLIYLIHYVTKYFSER